MNILCNFDLYLRGVCRAVFLILLFLGCLRMMFPAIRIAYQLGSHFWTTAHKY